MPHEFLNFMLALAVIVAVAKAAGYVSTRLGQPSVLGELLAGLLLGPTALDMLNSFPLFSDDPNLSHSITLMAELGVILLMMLAGLELDMSELLKSGKVSALSGSLGVVVPLAMGWATALLFGASNTEAIFIGLALSATSVSISAQTLMELNVLRNKVGLALLGSAVFDDVLVILLLSITSILVGTAIGGLSGIFFVVLRMAAYLIGASLLGLWVVPRLTTWVSHLPISQGLIAFSLSLCLLFAWAAEVVGGIAAITGAFLIGLFLARLPFKHRIETGISALAYGFFVPIFLVNIGLAVNLRAVSGSDWWFALAITLVAIVGKIIGSGLGGRLAGFDWLDSLRLGIGMISRGEVGLIVAAFALSQGFLSANSFSITVFMVIVTTLVTPPMLRAVYANIPPAEPEVAEGPQQTTEELAMYQMVVLVLDDLETTSAVLDAWEQVGVSGITVLESTGLGRTHKQQMLRDDLPLMPSLASMLQAREEEHHTLFTLVDDEVMVDRVIAATEEVTGPLEGQDNGILFVLPVLRAVGIVKSNTPDR